MKKFFKILLTIVTLFLFTACGETAGSSGTQRKPTQARKPSGTMNLIQNSDGSVTVTMNNSSEDIKTAKFKIESGEIIELDYDMQKSYFAVAVGTIFEEGSEETEQIFNDLAMKFKDVKGYEGKGTQTVYITEPGEWTVAFFSVKGATGTTTARIIKDPNATKQEEQQNLSEETNSEETTETTTTSNEVSEENTETETVPQETY